MELMELMELNSETKIKTGYILVIIPRTGRILNTLFLASNNMQKLICKVILLFMNLNDTGY